jgi:hypothetical protein
MGQVVDVYVSERRAAEDAATFFRRAIDATGMVPDEVTTDRAAAYPPALAAALPPVAHETGKRVQQRIERDHRHLKGRLHPMRGFKTLAGARLVCRAHALLRNLRGQFYDLASLGDDVTSLCPPMMRAWAAHPVGAVTRAATRLSRCGCAAAVVVSSITAQPNSAVVGATRGGFRGQPAT